MDGEDRHLCIVCNQTISGLLNYVLHRKNNCVNKKISEAQSNQLVNAIKFDVQELENRTRITESKAKEQLINDQHNDSQTLIIVEDDTPVDVQSENSSRHKEARLDQGNCEETVNNRSLPSAGYENNVSAMLDSKYPVDTSNSDDYFSDGESVNLHDIIPLSHHIYDVNKFSENLFSEDVSDNIRNVVPHTAAVEKKKLERLKTSYSKSDKECTGNKSVEPGFGILSVNVSGYSKSILPLAAGDHCPDTNADKISEENIRNNKRKKRTTKEGHERNGENTCKRKRCTKFNEKDFETGKYQEKARTVNGYNSNGIKDNNINMLMDSNKVLSYESNASVENAAHDSKEMPVNINNERRGESVNNCKIEENTLDPKVKVEKNDSGDVANNTQTMNETFSCVVCDAQFPNREKLVTHLLTAYHVSQNNQKNGEHDSQVEINQKAIIEESPFQCDLCKFYFNNSCYLEQHLKSKTHRKKYASSDTYVMCSLCNFVAESNVQLISHIHSPDHVEKVKQNSKVCAIKVSKIQKKKVKVCKICPSEFNKTSSARLHYQTAEHIRRKLGLSSEMLKSEKEENSDKDMETDAVKNEVNRKGDIVLVDDKQLENRRVKVIDNEEASVTKHVKVDNTKHLLNGENDKICSNQDEPGNDRKIIRISVCKFCAFETGNYSEMRIHYMKEHSQMVKICEVCDVVFPLGRGYKLHANSKDHQMNLERFGNKDLFQCHVCKKKFVEESYMKFHTAYFHYHLNSEEDLLKEGGKSITRIKYADFLDEIKGLRRNTLVSCPECSVSLRQNNMIGHLRIHTGEKPFKCNLCSDTFFNNFSLRRHLVQHFECWEKSCEVCGQSFKCKTGYNCHMDIHKAKVTGSGKSNVCHICGEAFYVKRKLKEHMSIHNEKNLKCDYPGCLWAFSNKHALKRHMLTHSDENPFICATCGYATKSEKYLKKHEQIHTKAKEFLCEHCTYRAMTKTHLRRHMRIHLGVKPFKCPYCSYTCNTHDNIRKHILETSFHKGLKVYPCTLCSYSTNSTNEYRTHIRLEHKEIPDENLKGSLAVLSGLFNKEEETKALTECTEILPIKERKSPKKKEPSSVKKKDTRPIEQEVVNDQFLFEVVEIF